MDDGQQIELQYPSPTTHSIQHSGAPSASAWSPSQPVGTAPAPDYTAAMFALHARQPDHVQYAASSPTAAHFVQQHQRNAVYSTPDTAGHGALPPGRPHPPATLVLGQIEGSVGPSRVLTRRQARAQAALQQSPTASSLHGAVHEGSPAGSTQSMFYPPPLSAASLSRPQTPSTAMMQSPPYMHPARPDFITLPNGGMSLPSGQMSPPYPSTPLSASPAHSPYNFFRHSRSASNATSNPRSASPALSIVSAMTSVSSASAHGTHGLQPSDTLPIPPMSPIINMEEKKKKGRLTNKDRKDICEYHQNVPDARQEDIAQLWNVERSTISKIIKAKDKWLAVPSEDNWKVAKHKPSKFPEIERELDKWLRANSKELRPQILSDQIIRNKAKDIARELHIPEEKFKASSGWVENFKHRHTIKRGVWMPGVTGNSAWIPDAVANAQSVGGGEDGNRPAGDPTSADERPNMNEDPAPTALQAAWEPVPAPATASGQPHALQPSPLPDPSSATSQAHPPPPHTPGDGRMDLTPTPVAQNTMADQHHYHADFQRQAFYGLGISAPTPTQPTAYSPVTPSLLPNTPQTNGGMAHPGSIALPTFAPGVMVYPPPKAPGASAQELAQHLATVGPPQPRRPPPSIQATEAAMELVLDFFDLQPELRLLTVEDREKLGQIRCKLHAYASGLPFLREDRTLRRASA